MNRGKEAETKELDMNMPEGQDGKAETPTAHDDIVRTRAELEGLREEKKLLMGKENSLCDQESQILKLLQNPPENFDIKAKSKEVEKRMEEVRQQLSEISNYIKEKEAKLMKAIEEGTKLISRARFSVFPLAFLVCK